MNAPLIFAIALAAVTGRTELLNETIAVPRSQWRALKVELRDRPATVEVAFHVSSGRSGVRVILMTSQNAERFEKGDSYAVLAQTGYQDNGRFSYLIANPDEYSILLDNKLEGREPAEVQVKVALLYHQYSSFVPKTLPPGKRQAVVGISLGAFALVSLLIGRKLVPAFFAGSQG